MKNCLDFVLIGTLCSATVAYAEPPAAPAPVPGDTVIWLPNAETPRDIHGNSAVANAPRPGATTPEPMGGLRDMPSWAPFGPSGADVGSISASPTASGVVIIGVGSDVGGGGIYRSTDGGANWVATNGVGNRRVNEVEFGGDGTGWAATDDGLFMSTDDGENWTVVALPVAGQALVEDVAVDPTNPSVIWVGLGQFLNGSNPTVVLKSTDGGVTWTDVSPWVGFGMGATVVAIDPANPNRVYAAFTGNFGAGNELWVTTDGGLNWSEVSGGLPNNMLNDIAFGPGGVVYVVGGQDFGSQFVGLYSTTDDGMSWNYLSAGWPSEAATAVAIDPANPSTILVGTTRAGLVRSTDGGATWTYSFGGTGTYSVNDIEFVPGATDVLLGMSSVAVFRSTDGGQSFSPSGNGLSQLQINSFAVNPLNSNEIAAAYEGFNLGGIFTSDDGGQTWTLSQAPLPRWKKVYFGPDGTLYAVHDGPLGRADDGLWRRNADGTWTNLGPGSPSALDNIGHDIAATSGSNPKILVAANAWLGSWAARIWSYNRAAPGVWELEYEGDFPNEETHGVLWLGGDGPVALATVVNFGSTGAGHILRSADGGDTWVESEVGYNPGWSAWGIEQGPQNDDTVYVYATENPGSAWGGLFKSTDGGLTWTQQGLTPAARCFIADPLVPGTFFIHPTWTGTGPQRSIDDGVTFEVTSEGFRGSAIYDFAYGGVVNGVRRLYAASYAGGWVTDLPAVDTGCPADWDGSGSVNSNDISAFLSSWLESVQNGTLTADFDGSGSVNSNDISAFLSAWLEAVQQGC